MNYTNFMIGEKFQNVKGLYNVMELYFFQNELHILGYKPTIPPQCCTLLH